MTYCEKLKEYLESINEKLPCCESAFNAGKILKEFNTFCIHDPGCYLRGIFVSYGSMTDPRKQYLVTFREEAADAAEDILISCGIFPLRSSRKGKTVLYIRESDGICDFLTIIGASKFALEFMETTVLKSIKKDSNRRSNAEFANLDKTATASALVCEAAKKLKENKDFEKLPEAIKETALLRLEYPELSLDALREKHSSAISKSGLYHRLKKIVEYAEASGKKKI